MTLHKGNRTLRKRPIFAPLLIPALSVIVGLLVLAWIWNAAETTTVILVRHAEKMAEPADDPDLSAMGAYRAKALAGWLRDAGIEHIYVSQFKRTQQTAAPVAETSGASVHELDAGDSKVLVKEILKRHRGQTVLVVGHSNTLPEIVRELGGEIDEIPEADYSRLVIVSDSPLTRAKVTSLRFGG